MAPLTFEQSMGQFIAEQQAQRKEQKAQFDKAQAELKEQRIEYSNNIECLTNNTSAKPDELVSKSITIVLVPINLYRKYDNQLLYLVCVPNTRKSPNWKAIDC